MARDEFSKPTIDTLSKRAGFLCSNPDCRQPTIGANEDDQKSTSIGIAAHITAASEGGPRYNIDLDPDQRSNLTNAIWLCSNCATLIDKDPQKYTVELLHEWKGGVEAESRLKLSKGFAHNDKTLSAAKMFNPILEVDFAGEGRSRSNRGYSMKNPTEMYEEQLVMVPGDKPIIYWALSWRYKLMIYNNSNYPAYNVNVEVVSALQFTEFEKLPKVNNIPPLDNKELKVQYEDWIEGVYYEADALLKPRYPREFDGKLRLKLTYYDEQRNEHISYVDFKDGEIINSKN